jgi:hypothetical protein
MDYIYVDNSNLYLEGKRVSAVKTGLAGDIAQAQREGILDHGYTISFGKLHEFLTGNNLGEIKRVTLFGSRPPPTILCGLRRRKQDLSCILKIAISRIGKRRSTLRSRHL